MKNKIIELGATKAQVKTIYDNNIVIKNDALYNKVQSKNELKNIISSNQKKY